MSNSHQAAKQAGTVKKVVGKRDSNANDILLSPNLMRPAPSNPNNRFMNSVTAVYKSLSSCSVRLSNIDASLAAQKMTATAATDSAGSTTPTRPMATLNNAAAARSLRNSVELHVAGDALDDDDSDGELFEFEESDAPHVPLYTLRDEGAIKWAMLTDLCGMLKVKSKDTLLKQVSETD